MLKTASLQGVLEKEESELPNTAQSRFVSVGRRRKVHFPSTMGENGENSAGLGDDNNPLSNPTKILDISWLHTFFKF